ncbi:MAG: hypothetical protein JWM37_383 [Candidatus Saccharibacteria bacterium]|nr:hypothetical protein [Candidatus Saccharibacteria bacterium]
MAGKILTTKPLLIMLYGCPGSGKSFFARQFSEKVQAAHLQTDRIRYELFDQPRYDKQENDVVNQLAHYMAGEFLQAGLTVVYDMNAMRISQRRLLRDLARKAHAVPVLVWLQIDGDTAYHRTTQRDRRRADDKYSMQFDKPTFQKLLINSQNPEPAEDYVVISGKHVFNTQFSAVMKRLHELNLVTGDEATSQVVKPGLVNLVPNQKAGRVDLSRRNIIIR